LTTKKDMGGIEKKGREERTTHKNKKTGRAGKLFPSGAAPDIPGGRDP
jgi:hypothetical protein